MTIAFNEPAADRIDFSAYKFRLKLYMIEWLRVEWLFRSPLAGNICRICILVGWNLAIE